MATTAPKIESADLNIETLFKDFYAVPDFQREYVWEPENVEALLRDIHDEFYDEQGRLLPENEYFIGSIVAFKDDDGLYQLIDGQQRMTTLYLILCALRDYIAKNEGSVPETLNGMIFAAQTDNNGNDVKRYRLQLQYEDSDGVLEKIVNGQDVPNSKIKTDSVENLLSAYRTIYDDFLTIEFKNDIPSIKKFYAGFVKRVKLIRIITPNISHALKVFETINDRGVGLNAMDLLKNLLFMKSSSSQHHLLKEKWEKLVKILNGCGEKPLRFLRYFIMARYDIGSAKPLKEDEIYSWLTDHKNASKTNISINPLEFIDLMIEDAIYYAQLVDSKTRSGGVNRYLENIAILSGKARQHFMLLLAARKLSDELVLELTKNIENLFFSYLVTREATKVLEARLLLWTQVLSNCSTKADLDAFINEHLKPDMERYRERFIFSFSEMHERSMQKYRLRYVMAKLTQFIDESAWSNPALANLRHYINSDVQIEHILPQEPTPYWQGIFVENYDDPMSKLGNLSLLEKTINGSISNSHFSTKLNGYKQSSFLLTKAIAEVPKVGNNTALNRSVEKLSSYQSWNLKSIESRQETLGQLALQVWGFS